MICLLSFPGDLTPHLHKPREKGVRIESKDWKAIQESKYEIKEEEKTPAIIRK